MVRFQRICGPEALRSEALEKATLAYVADHFADGVATVFAIADSPKKFIIQIVSNKYNPNNFWWASIRVLHSLYAHFSFEGRAAGDRSISLILIKET
jgi:hypothetical protein